MVRDGDTNGYALIELHTVTGASKGNVTINELTKFIQILPRKELIYSCLVTSSDPLKIIDLLEKSMTTTDQLRILFHDYFPVCPSYTLTGADNNYCDLPDQLTCEACYLSIKEKTGNLVDGIGDWRARWMIYLERAYEIEVFSQSSKEMLSRVWPEFDKKIIVRPHEIYNRPQKVNTYNNDRCVVGVLGSIGYNKGAKILFDLAEVAGDRLSIVIIGVIDPEYKHSKLQVHGRFKRDEITDLTERYSINRWLLPSIWPETFSYTTHECLATGLPTFAFDIGAQADTVRSHSNGLIVPLSIGMNDLVTRLVMC